MIESYIELNVQPLTKYNESPNTFVVSDVPTPDPTLEAIEQFLEKIGRKDASISISSQNWKY